MAPLTRGLELLRWAISYALASTRLATPQRLPCPTPCDGWDLGWLLHHVSDSVGVLHEAITAGCVGPGPAADDDGGPDPDVVSGLYRRAGRLLAACAWPPRPVRLGTWSPSVTANCPRGWPQPPGPSRSPSMAGTSPSRAAAASRSRRTWRRSCCRSPRYSSLPAPGGTVRRPGPGAGAGLPRGPAGRLPRPPATSRRAGSPLSQPRLIRPGLAPARCATGGLAAIPAGRPVTWAACSQMTQKRSR